MEAAKDVHERARGCREQGAVQQIQNVGTYGIASVLAAHSKQCKTDQGENNPGNMLMTDNMLSNPEKQGETNFNSFNSVLFNPVHQNIIFSSCNQHEKLLRYFTFFLCVCAESLKASV